MTFEKLASLNNCTKLFGDVVAVSEASFSIDANKIIGFLGPNGAGKTTAIRMLLGLLRPQTGTVELLGKDPFNNSSARGLIGYISEEEAFPKWIKAQEFLMDKARFYMSKEDARDRSLEVLEEVDLLDVANKRVRAFSKGMKQRIKIAQALLHKPLLVIADEPFNGLDPVIRRSMFELFNQYKYENNTTFFISSHILSEMEKIAEKIILLYKGRTIAHGSPHRIRDMIDDQPHTIQIRSDKIREIAYELVKIADRDTVLNIGFQLDKLSGKDLLQIMTNSPKEFYELLTDFVVRQRLEIEEIRATDEGLQNLFNALTVG